MIQLEAEKSTPLPRTPFPFIIPSTRSAAARSSIVWRLPEDILVVICSSCSFGNRRFDSETTGQEVLQKVHLRYYLTVRVDSCSISGCSGSSSRAGQKQPSGFDCLGNPRAPHMNHSADLVPWAARLFMDSG